MPSLQTALPPELANNAIRNIKKSTIPVLFCCINEAMLYRECLRRAKYIGQKKFNTELLITMVREQLKKNMHETDPDKIQRMKDDAARGLINHMIYESENLSGRKFNKSTDGS